MGGKYIDEVKQLLLKLLKEYNTIVNSTVDVKDLNENQIVNTLLPGTLLLSFMSLMDHYLVNVLKTDKVTFAEMEPFLRCFWGHCYYSCSVEDVKNHPDTFPLISKEVNCLVGETFKFDS